LAPGAGVPSHGDSTANVLIAGADASLARSILEILARRALRGVIAGDARSAADFAEKNDCDLVFINIDISSQPNTAPRQNHGLELLKKLRTASPELSVVMIAGPDKTNAQPRQVAEAAVRAMQTGCRDFLLQPVDAKKIENLLDTFAPNHKVATIAWSEQDTHTLYKIVGRSSKLIQTVNLAKKVAPTSAPVLITGESGTGKELISHLIHHNSRRTQQPYVKVNCAALSETLLESELFGHEKGAFTGAYMQRKGRFEMANGGTLLLDEITETPSRFQAKLLRVLEQQDFERVGGNNNIKVDVRIISTSNKDLQHEVSQGRFRQDLYYRLNGVRLVVAPLRERPEDLPDLVWHFVNIYAHQGQRQISRLDPAMTEIFTNYHWPGNVRQLRNVVLTSLLLGVGQTLSLADVSWLSDELQPREQIAQQCDLPESKPSNLDEGLGDLALVDVERRAILDTLRKTEGNRTRAAKVLGISDRTLRDKIRRYRRQGCLEPVL